MNPYRTRKLGEKIRDTYQVLLNQWGISVHEMMLPSRYGATHVIAAGREDAPPLVLFHGVGDDAALMWIYNAGALASHFRIYAVDTLGGPGKSEIGKEYNRQFDDVTWMDEIMDGLHLEQAFLAGVSHGGYLVQLYTLKRPERVRKGLCISSQVFDAPGGSPMAGMMKIFLPEALIPSRKNTLKLLKKLSGNHPQAFTENPDILAHYQALLLGFNNMAMGRHKVRCFSAEEIGAVREKLLFLAGEEDPFQKQGGRDSLLRHRMQAIWYPGAGHGLNHELPDIINEKIRAYFLENH